MGEHDSFHKLNIVAATCREHFLEILDACCARFFGEEMLSGFGRTNDPELPNCSGKGNVDRIDMGCRQKLLIGSVAIWNGGHGTGGLAFGDESTTAIDVATCDRRHGGTLGVINRLPVFLGNLGRSQNSPANDAMTHERCCSEKIVDEYSKSSESECLTRRTKRRRAEIGTAARHDFRTAFVEAMRAARIDDSSAQGRRQISSRFARVS